MVNDRTLYVVRGSYRGFDPTFACVAQRNTSGKFCMLEVDDTERVVRREIEGDIRSVEAEMNKYRAVFVDTRDEQGLVPMPKASHAQPMDLESFTRPKSNDEFRGLRELKNETRRLLDTEGMDANKFRGAAQTQGHRAYFNVHHSRGFTEYRGGMQNEAGLCSDLTKVVAHNDEWRERLDRVYKGLAAVEAEARVGVEIQHLDSVMKAHLDPTKDKLASSCVHSTGYKNHERFENFRRIEPYDHLTLGVAISDGTDVALVYNHTCEFMDGGVSDRAVFEEEQTNPEPATTFRGAQVPSTAFLSEAFG